MNAFIDAIANQEARTENFMKARKSTASALVDLFYKIGASRGKDIIPTFVAAYVADPELAVRVALWARDVRGGAGERKVFRDILSYLSDNDPDRALRVIEKVPELGRWDDLFATRGEARKAALEKIASTLVPSRVGHPGIANRNDIGLVAKWMPRKGLRAVELRNVLGLSPKSYRKLLVTATQVVETQMCAKQWDEIDYNKVPSLASARYKKAFGRHSPEKFAAYTTALVKGEEGVKVNAGAVFPYDILKGLRATYMGGFNQFSGYSQDEKNHIKAQWDALPNYVGDASILPIVDVSGSMES